jgi:hypothetical protein
MKTVLVDYNAATPTGAFRLDFRAALDNLRQAGKAAGDWAWLSDGEVLVVGRLRHDPDWGTVATPDWEMVVHRGLMLLKLGKSDEARRAFELAHVIEPQDVGSTRRGALLGVLQHEFQHRAGRQPPARQARLRGARERQGGEFLRMEDFSRWALQGGAQGFGSPDVAADRGHRGLLSHFVPPHFALLLRT